MKSIAIFGSYNGNSVGDTAILLGLLSSINRTYPNCEVTILSVRRINIKQEIAALEYNLKIKIEEISVFYDKVEYLEHNKKYKWFALRAYQKIFNKSLLKKNKVNRLFSKFDHLIIGGGNLVMDLFPEWPLIIKDITNIAVHNNVPYTYLGVGAGPLDEKRNKKIFKRSLNQASRVYFRDLDSMKYTAQQLSYFKGQICPDCAFGLEAIRTKNTEITNTLLVNVASVYGQNWPYKSEEKFRKYIDSVYKLVMQLMQDKGLTTVEVFNTNHPLDTEASSLLVDILKENRINCVYHSNRLKVQEILDICHTGNYAFVTRLHAGILATISECEVFAIAYQPKVIDLLKNIHPVENIIEIGKITEGDENPLFILPISNQVNTDNLRHHKEILKKELDVLITNILE